MLYRSTPLECKKSLTNLITWCQSLSKPKSRLIRLTIINTHYCIVKAPKKLSLLSIIEKAPKISNISNTYE